MKTQILALSLIALGLSAASTAEARHAYRGMRCVSDKYQFNYLGNYPVGGSYGMDFKDAEFIEDGSELLVLPNDPETYGEDYLSQAEVIFTETARQDSTPEKTSDGCYDREDWVSKITIRLDRVSTEASNLLGIHTGESLEFTCNEYYETPSEGNCE